MTLDRYFRLSSYTLLATSFAMLAATRQLDLLSLVLFAGVLVTGWLMDAGHIRGRIPPRLVNWLMIFYLPFAVADWLLFGSPPLVALIHFIFFAASFKLLQPKQNRDWMWLYVVSFFEMLLAAGMMVDTSFFLLLLVFLFAAVLTLVSFELRRAQQDLPVAAEGNDLPAFELGEVEYWRESSARRLGQPRWRNLTWFSAITLVLILLLATPLFLVMPRLSLRSTSGGWLRGGNLSGFSETVRLGDVAQIKLNPQLVMRVRVVQPPEQYRAQLRWRGVTFDYYDGRTWRDSSSWQHSQAARARMAARRGNTFWLSEGEKLADRAESIPQRSLTLQTFFLEPLETSTIFAAPTPLWVEGLRSLWHDESDGLWTNNHAFNRLVYSVESDTRPVADAELRADNSKEYAPEISERYVRQLPANRDRRVDELAAQVTRGAKTTLDKARRIEQHLRTAYGYTLDLKRTNDGDPVADFLFNVRAGHCEYFATAMTLMLRSQGIPARLVNGFQMGEYSEVSDFYTVRQSDAHSWVEVYFPEHGWIAFDPTPSAGLSKYDTGWLAIARHYGEATEMFWLEHVIGFGTSEQMAMVITAQRWLAVSQGEAGSWLADLKARLSEWVRAWRSGSALNAQIPLTQRLLGLALHPLVLALYAIGAVISLTAIWRRHAHSWRRQAGRNAPASAVAFYQEMLAALARAGHQRRPDQTPQELADLLTIQPVTELTQLYQRVRFGSGSLTASEVARVEALLREVKALRRIKP